MRKPKTGLGGERKPFLDELKRKIVLT